EPQAGARSRHGPAIVPNTGNGMKRPVERHAKARRFPLSDLEVMMSPSISMLALSQRSGARRQVGIVGDNVLVTCQYHHRISEQASEVILAQTDATHPLRKNMIKSRQAIPTRIGGCGSLVPFMCLTTHQPMDKLSTRRVSE